MASHSAIALAGGAIAVGGGVAAAAVATIDGRPSHPTAGLVPRGPQEHRRRDLHYKLTVAPSLTVGQIGWCEQVALRYTPSQRFGGGGCAYAALKGVHVFGGSTIYMGNGRGLLATMIVDRSVAYAQLTSGDKIIPASDPALPNRWRAIVLLPGESHDGKIHIRDAAGRPFPGAYKRSAKSFAPPQPTSASTTGVPADAPCSIKAPPSMDPRGSHWLRTISPTKDLPGYAFAACAQTGFRIDRAYAEVTVLLDAAHPGSARPAPLSGASPQATGDVVQLPAVESFYPGPGGSFNGSTRSVPAGDVGSARRVGNAWVVVRAKSESVRMQVLRAIRIEVPGG